jgi:hypothetical protein
LDSLFVLFSVQLARIHIAQKYWQSEGLSVVFERDFGAWMDFLFSTVWPKWKDSFDAEDKARFQAIFCFIFQLSTHIRRCAAADWTGSAVRHLFHESSRRAAVPFALLPACRLLGTYSSTYLYLRAIGKDDYVCFMEQFSWGLTAQFRRSSTSLPLRVLAALRHLWWNFRCGTPRLLRKLSVHLSLFLSLSLIVLHYYRKRVFSPL